MGTFRTGFLKYAHVAVIEAVESHISLPARSGELMERLATHYKLDPSRFIYTRERAISAYELHGLNGNYDGWVDDELAVSYASFQNVPRFVDHDNMDERKAVGLVLDAEHHVLDKDPGSGWVETVSAKDKSKLAQVNLHHLQGQPTLLEALLDGTVTDVSMGCYVDESVCTVCGNLARDPIEYCDHVRTYKGAKMKIGSRSPLLSLGYNRGDEVICGELNYGVTFFELSDITTQAEYGGGGADRDAKTLERVAQAAPVGWESQLEMRMSTNRPTRKAHGKSVTEAGHTINTSAWKNTTMSKQKKQAVVEEPNLQQVIVDDDKIAQEDAAPGYDPDGNPDKDDALLQQSQGTSAPPLKQVIVDDDKIAQEKTPKDHPQPNSKATEKGAEFIPTDSDPSNAFGGKPEQVRETEEEIDQKKFQDIKPRLDPGQADDVENDMKEDDDQEEREIEEKMSALIPFLSSNEAVAQRIDEFEDVLGQIKVERGKIASLNSAGWKRKRLAVVGKHLARARTIVSELAKYAYGKEVGSGSAMQQEAIDAEGYDQGDPDKNLNQQSQGKSESSPAEHVMTPEDVAQDEAPDHSPSGTPGKAAMILTASDADAAADEITRLMMEANMPYEDAFSAVMDQYGTSDVYNTAAKTSEAMGDVMTPDIPMGAAPKNEKVLDLSLDEDDMEEDATNAPEVGPPATAMGGKKTAEEGGDEVDPKAGESASDISSGVTEDATADVAIGKGTRPTKESPATKSVTNAGELLQTSASLSTDRAAMLRQAGVKTAEGAEGAEERLDMGTHTTKESPATNEIADEENVVQKQKLEVETKGQTGTPEAPVLSFKNPVELLARRNATLRNRLVALQKKEAFLREQNERLYKKAEAIKASWKFEVCKKLASVMLRKGLFVEVNPDDPSQGQRGLEAQKQAAKSYAKELMRYSNEEVESQMKLIARMPDQDRIPKWTKVIEKPREGMVRKAIASPTRPVQGLDLNDNFFEED